MRPSAFTDVKQVLDEALRLGGGTYVLATHGEAVNFRHRAYKFRKSYFETFRDPKYDALTLPRIDPESTEVVINVAKAKGLFVPHEGEAITHPTTSLDEAAAQLAEKILKGDIL